MITNFDNIVSVIDHRNSEGTESVYEVQIEWDKSELDVGDKYTWVPFTDIYKELPQLLSEYFSFKKVSLEAILSAEVQARQKKKKNGFQAKH